MTKQIYRHEEKVPAFSKFFLEEAIAKLAKTAERLGWQPLELVTSEIYTVVGRNEIGFETIGHFFDYTIYGEAPRLAGGWKFVASLEHTEAGTIVKLAPDFYGDETQYASAEPRCEHCSLKRSRLKTIIIESETGERKQIGSTCLKDFLGHSVPSVWSFLASLESLEDEYEEFKTSKAPLHSVVSFLAVTVATIEEFGWVSKAQAELNKKATVWVVEDILSGKVNSKRFPITAEHHAKAVEVIKWLEATPADSTYISNLKIAVQLGTVDKHAGLVASAVEAHRKATEAEATKELKAKVEKTPAPLGKVTIEGTVTSAYIKDTDYGSRFVFTVLDDKGFTVWGSVPKGLFPTAGDKVRFTAEITAVSNEDPTFGFFKRPSKAEILATVG
jgi:hypothetical protein